jgi:hypothetical protein
MYPNIASPYYFINAVALTATIGLSGFVTSRILATAPDITMRAPQVIVAPHAVLHESYSGILAWVNADEIKLTDNFGVSRAITLDKNTRILIKGFPAGSASYTDLRMLDHVRITTIKDGSDERAETILVQ